MVTGVEFEFRDRSSNPIVCQITDESLRQVVYILTVASFLDYAIEEVCINRRI